MKRCDALIVQVVVTEYDAAGVPIGETIAPSVKVFLGNLPAFVEAVHAQVAKLNAAQA